MQYRKPSYAEGVFDAYWFEKNLQGDIVAVYSETGVKLISYTYDAWGNCTVAYENGGDSCMARYNPFRYRGYYYDSETGFYYLNSRYYDPVIGRFVNADSVIADAGRSLHGFNMFSYCFNNFVNMYDQRGNWPTWNDILTIGKKAVDRIVHQDVFIISSPLVALIGRELHYGRNIFNTTYTEQELLDLNYEALGKEDDTFHQNNQRDNERNRKYVIGDWFSSEMVYYSDGTINNTPEDMGTFNVYSGEHWFYKIIVHGIYDVVPYMVWGNSRDDSTTIVDRLIMIWE